MEKVTFKKLDIGAPRTKYVPNDNVVKIVSRFDWNTNNADLFMLHALGYLYDLVKEGENYDRVAIDKNGEEITVACFFKKKEINTITVSRPDGYSKT